MAKRRTGLCEPGWAAPPAARGPGDRASRGDRGVARRGRWVEGAGGGSGAPASAELPEFLAAAIVGRTGQAAGAECGVQASVRPVARQAEVPGFLPYIGDYSQIVVFGSTGSGDPFCLDYRDDPQEPKVIFFQDGYWQRVAPNFDAFWELLEPDP